MKNPWKEKSNVNPQVEGKGARFRRINTEILRALITAGLSGGEWSIFMVVVDETWGRGEKWWGISLSTYERATTMTRPGVIRAIKLLELKNILLVNRSLLPTRYSINKHYDTWVVNRSLLGEVVNRSLPKKVNESLLAEKVRPINSIKKRKKPPYISPLLGEFQNIKLTKEERKKLDEKLGPKKALELIESASSYFEQIGPRKAARYKSHYATILNWDRMEKRRDKFL